MLVTTATAAFYAKTILTAGTDTAISTSTGNITIWNTSTLQTITDRGSITTNAITINNDSYSVSFDSGNALQVVGGVGIGETLSVGVAGFINNAQIITTATVKQYTVTGLSAGTDTAVSTSTGGVVIWNTSTLQSITNKGSTTNNAISITNTTAGTGTTTGALVVSGSVGVGGNIYAGGSAYINTTSYVAGFEIITTATIGNYSNKNVLTAGTDTAISTSTGNITIWNTSTLQTITDRGYSTNNPIVILNSADSSNPISGALIVTGGAGFGKNVNIQQNLYASAVYDNNTRVLTGINAIAGTGILIQQSVPTGSVVTFTVTNTGVLSLIGGTDITVSDLTGNITISDSSTLQTVTDRGSTTNNSISINNNTASTSTTTGALIVGGGVGIGGTIYAQGALFVNTTSYIVGSQIITTATVNDFATKTILTAGTDTVVNTSTGNVTIWNTSTLQSITSRGSSTNQIITITNTTTSTNTTTGALIVKGGVGIGGTVYIATDGYISGSQIITTGTIGLYASSNFTITGGTDTAVSTASGILIWSTATLDSIAHRYGGNSTTATIYLNNTQTSLVTAGTIAGVITTATYAITASTSNYATTASLAIFARSASTASYATNLTAGSTGSVVYQATPGTTAFLPLGASGTILQSDGTVPSWVTLDVLSSSAQPFIQGIVYAITTGTGGSSTTNVALGWGSLSSNNGGSKNVAVGYQSLLNNTSGYDNIAMGYGSLYSNTVGRCNTAIGSQALCSNISGAYNVGIGNYALSSNKIGNTNVAIGGNALYYSTGSGNIAVGSYAGMYLTTGSGNVFLGEYTSNSTPNMNNTVVIADGIGAVKVSFAGSGAMAFGSVTTSTTPPGLAQSGVGKGGQLLSSDGSFGPPIWVDTSTYAKYLSNPNVGSIPVQNNYGGNVYTSFLNIGTSGSLLTSNGYSPSWSNSVASLAVTNTTSSTSSYSANALYVAGGIGGNSGFKINGNGYLTGDLFVTGKITGTNVTLGLLSANSGTFYGDATGNGSLYAGVSGYTPFPQTIIQATGNLNNYMETNVQNISAGAQASTDIVASADNVTSNSAYIDMGITSSGWDGTQANSLGTALSPNDGYIMVGQNTTAGNGDLVFGTTTSGTNMKFVVAATGTVSLASVAMTINPVNTQAVSTTTGALIVSGGAGIANNLYVGGNVSVGGTINASITGIISTATSLDGGAAGSIPYQISEGKTGFIAIGGSNSILTSNGTTATYVNTLTLSGTVSHAGLVPTAGLNIDQIYSTSTTLILTTSWQNTGISSSILTSGTYIVQTIANDLSVGGGGVNTYYSGIMSWYGLSTTESRYDEIVLHRAGAAEGTGTIYLQVLSSSTGVLNLQIAGNTNNSGNSVYKFTFRRMI